MKRLLLAVFFTCSYALASPGIIFIHGFGNFFDNGSSMNQGFSSFYWAYWNENGFQDREVRELTWDSKYRILDQLDNLVTQYKTFIEEGHCDDGCVVITHSTGGLVADILMSRSLESKGSENDFSEIQASTKFMIQVASAIGGVAIARDSLGWIQESCEKNPKGVSNYFSLAALALAIDAGKVPNTTEALGTVVRGLFPHIKCDDIEGSAGAAIDLIPEIAREINHSDNTSVMTFMVAGNGDLFGGILKEHLIGESDGLVAMHSACGAKSVGAYESCVPHINASGKTEKVYSAPKEFYRNHYPIIMTQEAHDSQLAPIAGFKNEVVLEAIDFEDPIDRGTAFKILGRLNFATLHLSEMIGGFFRFDEP